MNRFSHFHTSAAFYCCSDFATLQWHLAATFREILKLDRKAKVLIITAYPETALMSEALDVGSFGLMKKPIDLEDLRRVLSDIAATAGGVRR